MISRDERLRVVGIGGTLREGSTCLGALRRALAAAEEADGEGNITDESYGGRQERLGRLVVEMAEGLSSGARGAAVLGAAV